MTSGESPATKTIFRITQNIIPRSIRPVIDGKLDGKQVPKDKRVAGNTGYLPNMIIIIVDLRRGGELSS